MEMKLKVKIVYFIALLMLCALSACSTTPTNTKQDVGSNTIAYYFQKGQGPTIVFQSGLGDGKDVWSKTLKYLPDSASIFLYDRPGYGGSPETSDPRDPCTISRELDELLRTVGVSPPYILVGHSLGGLDQFYYASLFPDQVAGLVLLDPTHPNHWESMQSEAKAQASLITGLRNVVFSRVMRHEFDDQIGCLDALDSEGRNDFPSILLFSGKFQMMEIGSFETMVRKLRKEWAYLLVNSRHSEIANSSHYIQKDAPEEVARAIEKLLVDIRYQGIAAD
jgi:pimeloyl-ACP methyl ester carboxylesterase